MRKEIRVKFDKVEIVGDLALPDGAKSIVIFAHGSGSSRFSKRNKFVAEELQKLGLGTFLLDLLTEEEDKIDEVTREFRFDVEMLGRRLILAKKHLIEEEGLEKFQIGYFGSSTGAAAALIAASKDPENVAAVVSRGGRADMAIPYLRSVKAPTLLIVGENDETVIEMNREAQEFLDVENKLEIVAGASHLFEESGALETVAELAGGWFQKCLK